MWLDQLLKDTPHTTNSSRVLFGAQPLSHTDMVTQLEMPSPSVFVAHIQMLQNSTAKYPIKRTVCKAFDIPQHYRDVTYERWFPVSFPRYWSSGWCATRHSTEAGHSTHSNSAIQPHGNRHLSGRAAAACVEANSA